MKYGVIYKATCIKNNKVYIGQSVNIFNRIKQHKRDSVNSKLKYKKFYIGINKYGWDNFEWEVIDYNIPEIKLAEMEIFYVAKYNSYDNGYNSTKGGDTSPSTNPEVALKISRSMTGKKHTEERKRINSLAHIGIKLSEEHKQKISVGNSGKTMSNEAKIRISVANKGRIFTKEHILKISENHADIGGANNPMYGKAHTDKAREKISNAKSSKWEITDPKGIVHLTYHLKTYCKNNQLSYRCMLNVAKGNQSNHKNFKCIKTV